MWAVAKRSLYCACVPFIRQHKNILVCVEGSTAVWSSYIRFVLKVTVSRGYVCVRLTEELLGRC